MKAVVSDVTAGKALLCKLHLSDLRQKNEVKITEFTIEDIHRKFHYEVVRWLQDQGYDTIG